MTELIRIQNKQGIETVNARELWEKLGSKQEFANWIKSRLDCFENGIDFTVDKFINGKATQVDYHVTLDTAKHIAMLERNEIGKKVRQYFIDFEKQNKFQIPKTYAEALRLSANQAEIIELQQSKIALDAPKVKFYDTVIGSNDTIDLGETAKILNRGIGRNKLFEILRMYRVLNSKNIPYQRHIDNGYFRIIETSYTENSETRIYIKTVVYQKGVEWIGRLLDTYFKDKINEK